MIARVIAIVVLLGVLNSYASPSARIIRWNPSSAIADAARDIAAGKIRFAYVGAFAPFAPGVPDGANETLHRYGRLEVGPQGCTQDEHSPERNEYARRYNQKMWSYVSKHR